MTIKIDKDILYENTGYKGIREVVYTIEELKKAKEMYDWGWISNKTLISQALRNYINILESEK